MKARALLLLLGYSCSILAQPHPDDVVGATDFARIERFPHSYITYFEQREAPAYALVVGRIQKRSSGSVPEKVQRLSGGVLTRLTYRIPSRQSPRDVFEHFREQLRNAGAQVLYQCRSRECGDSNVWANQVFGIAQLYGPDRQQAYLAAHLPGRADNKEAYVSLYVIERANRRLYAHLERLEPAGAAGDAQRPDPQRWLTQLLRQGRLVTDIRFTGQGDISAASDVTVELLAQMLQLEPQLPVYVVAHSSGNHSLEELLQLSRQRAERVVTALVRQGIAADRLSAHGVGPLAPPAEQGVARNRVELVLPQLATGE